MMDFEAAAKDFATIEHITGIPDNLRKVISDLIEAGIKFGYIHGKDQGREDMKKECLALCTWGKTEHGERYPTVRGVAEEIKKL